MSLRTPLSRVRGLGSAKEGAHHWIVQRATAIALVPLVLLLLYGAVTLAGQPYEAARAYLANPFVAVASVLLIFAGFWHARLGLQEVVLDYIHKESTRVVLLLLINFVAFAGTALGFLSVLRVYVTG